MAIHDLIMAAAGVSTASGGNPTFASVGSAAVSSSTSLTLSNPAGINAGDLLIAVAGSDTSGVSYTPPTGWTEVQDSGNASSTMIAYRVYQAGDASNWTWTISNGAAKVRGQIMCYTSASFGGKGTLVATAGPTASVTIPSGTATVIGLSTATNTQTLGSASLTQRVSITGGPTVWAGDINGVSGSVSYTFSGSSAAILIYLQ